MNERSKRNYSLPEVCELTGVTETIIFLYIEREWITPIEPSRMDDEDLARLRLIRDLEDLGINGDAVPVVLHLVDQLYYLRAQMRKLEALQKGFTGGFDDSN